MDYTTIYPEGLNRIVDDKIVEDLEDYYQKSIDKITDNEIEAYEARMYEKAMGE